MIALGVYCGLFAAALDFFGVWLLCRGAAERYPFAMLCGALAMAFGVIVVYVGYLLVR